MPTDPQLLSDLFDALRDHIDARLEGLHQHQAPGEAVRGLREAARHLRVSKATVGRVIDELPAARKPVQVGDGRPTWWWRSRDALFDWWEAAHSIAIPPKAKKRTTTPKRARTRQPDRRHSGAATSLAERLRNVRLDTNPDTKADK